MRNLVFLSFFLFSAPALSINYYWCEKSEDCAKAYGGCGRYFSVHKRYKELFEAKAHKGDRTSFCLKPTKLDQQYKFEGESICKQKRCRLTLAKKSTSKK